MLPNLFRQAEAVPSDLNDILRVFVFSNLDALATPGTAIIVTPDIQAAIVVGLNSIRVRDRTDLATDLKDILDVFIIANASTIIGSTTAFAD